MKIHSVVDLITNSSTEIFVVRGHSLEEVTEVLTGKGRPCSDCPYKSGIDFGGGPAISINELTQKILENYWYDESLYEAGDIEVSYDINVVDYTGLKNRLIEEFGDDSIVEY